MTDMLRAQDQLFDRRTSAREKYAALVVGRPGWRALVKHEFVTMASQSTPGALGLALRQALYPALLGACEGLEERVSQRTAELQALTRRWTSDGLHPEFPESMRFTASSSKAFASVPQG